MLQFKASHERAWKYVSSLGWVLWQCERGQIEWLLCLATKERRCCCSCLDVEVFFQLISYSRGTALGIRSISHVRYLLVTDKNHGLLRSVKGDTEESQPAIFRIVEGNCHCRSVVSTQKISHNQSTHHLSIKEIVSSHLDNWNCLLPVFDKVPITKVDSLTYTVIWFRHTRSRW